MANRACTTLICKNPEAIRSIISNGGRIDLNLAYGIAGRSNKLGYEDSDFINSSFTQCEFKTPWDVPHEDILQLSKNFPDDIITCYYCFEDELYEYDYKFEYKNGEYEQIDVLVAWDIPDIPGKVGEELGLQAQKNILNFFKKICNPRKIIRRAVKLDYCGTDEELSYTFIVDDYKFKAIKKDYLTIDVDIFKKNPQSEALWEPFNIDDVVARRLNMKW